jgi:hypothetical protein
METLPRKWVRDIVTMTNLLIDGHVKQYRRYTYLVISTEGDNASLKGLSTSKWVATTIGR